MARQMRRDEPGAIHHVFGRGNHKISILAEPEDRDFFLRRLWTVKAECRFKLYAYCLMGNHYHLLIETGPVPLARIMQKVLTSYSRYVNDKTVSMGHVFQGRYSAKRCQRDSYFSALLAYIHLNPVEAGLVARPEHWRWSGHREILDGGDGLLNRKDLLTLLSGGVESYADSIRLGLAGIGKSTEQSALSQIIASTARDFGYSIDELVGPSRERRFTEARQKIVRAALEASCSLSEIAARLGRTSGAIWRLQ